LIYSRFLRLGGGARIERECHQHQEDSGQATGKTDEDARIKKGGLTIRYFFHKSFPMFRGISTTRLLKEYSGMPAPFSPRARSVSVLTS
jgi:hypothetical protein